MFKKLILSLFLVMVLALPSYAAVASTDEAVLGNQRWSVESGSGSFIPNANGTQDIGSTSYTVNNIYADTVVASTLTVSGNASAVNGTFSGPVSSLYNYSAQPALSQSGGTVLLNGKLGSSFTLALVGGGTVNYAIQASSLTAGQPVSIIITGSGTYSTVSFASGFKTGGTIIAGTGSGTNSYALSFISNGNFLEEMGRATGAGTAGM